MIGFFTEFILSRKPRPFAPLRVTARRAQNDNDHKFLYCDNLFEGKPGGLDDLSEVRLILTYGMLDLFI